MTFKQIVIADKVTIPKSVIDAIDAFSENPIRVYDTASENKDEFKMWISEEDNFFIMDTATDKELYEEIVGLDRVILSDYVSGLTKEAELRLGEKSLANIKAFLDGKPIQVIN